MNVARVLLVYSTLICINAEAQTTQINRKVLMTALEDRLKQDSSLISGRNVPRSDLNLDPNMIRIPGIPRGAYGANTATFAFAFAYVASQELGIPFVSRSDPFALVVLAGVDSNHLSINLDASVRGIADQLLRAAFGDAPCRFPHRFAYFSLETEFVNSICADLKQVVSKAKQAHSDAQLLATAKSVANEELSESHNLLQQAPDYDQKNQLISAEKGLELALETQNLDEIRAKTQALSAVNEGLKKYIWRCESLRGEEA